MIFIIQRLYIKEFLKVFAIISIGLSSIFGLVGLIDKIDNFLPYNPPPSFFIKYWIFSIPKYLTYLLPMATLLSILFVFSMAVKRKEIVAIKASAGKMKSILSPFVIIGVVLVFLGFFIGEIIVPLSAKKNTYITNIITKKKKESAFKDGVLFMKGRDGSIIRIGLYVQNENMSKDVSIYKIDREGLVEKIDAERATWQDNLWRLKGIRIYDFKRGIIRNIDEMTYDGISSLEVFQAETYKIEEMTIVELIRYNKRLKEAGFRNTKLLVDINSRLSYSFINLFMLLLGIALSLTHDFSEQKLLKIISIKKIKEGTFGGGIIAAGLGLLISLIYWFGYSFFLSLGYAEVVPPIIAPWIIPIIFGCVSFYLYSQIPE
jgi:lipopolysaccharide export system permease protein